MLQCKIQRFCLIIGIPSYISTIFWFSEIFIKDIGFETLGCASAIASTSMLSVKPFVEAKMMAICSSTGTGEYWGCFRTSWFFRPLSIVLWVAASRSDPNLAKASSSLNCAWSSLSVPAAFYIDLIWALPPTLDTEIPTLIAGLIPELKRFVSRNIWPSVIEITFVGI